MIEKTASVHGEGPGNTGLGQTRTETGTLKSYPYGFGSRSEDNRKGSNPEEMLAAAHAACCTMALTLQASVPETRLQATLLPRTAKVAA